MPKPESTDAVVVVVNFCRSSSEVLLLFNENDFLSNSFSRRNFPSSSRNARRSSS
jgi:hypothetical protein